MQQRDDKPVLGAKGVEQAHEQRPGLRRRRRLRGGRGIPRLGHPLLARGNRLGEGGHPAPHELQRRTYTTGDRLVLYTDGLVECADPDRQQLRERHFRHSLITTASFSLVEQRNALVADLNQFFGDAPRDDDVTLVLAELE